MQKDPERLKCNSPDSIRHTTVVRNRLLTQNSPARFCGCFWTQVTDEQEEQEVTVRCDHHGDNCLQEVRKAYAKDLRLLTREIYGDDIWLTPEKKKTLTYINIACFFFLAGVEYAIILPTVWLYLNEEFDAQPYMLGLVMTAFYISGFFASPLLGWWSDYSGNTKSVLLFGNLWVVAGSLMYFIGLNQWFLFGARLVAGVGTGSSASLFADVTRLSSEQERTSKMAMFLAAREVGTLTGPACNLFLRNLDFQIGAYTVDKYTAPGLFMAITWVVYEVFVLCFYWNVRDIEETNTEDNTHTDGRTLQPDMNTEKMNIDDNNLAYDLAKKVDENKTASNESTPPMLKSTNSEIFDGKLELQLVDIEFADNTFISSDDESKSSHIDDKETDDSAADVTMATGSSSPAAETDDKSMFVSLYDEYVRDEIVALLMTIFAVCFSEMALETMLTPMSAALMGWDEFENSIMFAGCGLQLLVMFVVIFHLSKHYTDRFLVLCGVSASCLSALVYLIYVPLADPADHMLNTIPYLLALAIELIGLPIVLSSAVSLYSKLTAQKTQGLSQGVQRAFNILASVLGPLWAASNLQRPVLMLSVQLAVQVIALILVAVSYKRLQT